MPVQAFLNLQAHHPCKKITRRSVARWENAITVAVSGPVPVSATRLTPGTYRNMPLHQDFLIRCYADIPTHQQYVQA